ncbi:hypothetical protein evm_003080 [Chilo suppressalis]|nr:hypothetical protein evm_003080 [Chilo suppressalis]
MAPRSTKVKKAADVKVPENDAPKKGRGKAKNVEQESENIEPKLLEKTASVPEKKIKRGKKVVSDTNGEESSSVKSDDTISSAKKGKKKNSEDKKESDPVNGDNHIEKDTTPVDESDQERDPLATNSDTEEIETAPKGHKKPQKKDVEAKTNESGRGKKKTKQEKNTEGGPEDVENGKEKSKTTNKGRGRKTPAKVESEPIMEEKIEPDEDEAKAGPVATKGKRKAQNKPRKEKIFENGEQEVKEENDNVENKSEKDTKKKESKGKKNQAKKMQVEDANEKEEVITEKPVAKKRKTTKKDTKAKGDTKEEEVMEEEPLEEKPAKGKRRQKKALESPVEAEEEPQDTGEQPTKRRRKQAEEKAPAADKKKAALKNKAATNYEELDFANSSKNAQGKEWNYKISSWNVDGIRAWLGKGGLEYLKHEQPDILCLQEVKCAQDKLPEELVNVPGYHAYWLCSDQDGYAGVGIYTSKLAMNVQYGLQNEDLDSEGRIITAEYEHFYLISTYVPNAGRKLVTLPKRLQWNEAFRKYVKDLDTKKPVIICGDMNVAHNEIDLANPKTNKKNAGFTQEERAGMTELLGDGFVDTYRHLYPDTKGAYTFWTYMMNSRAKNVGWRLDYFIVSERLLPSICDSVIRDGVYGSDHCPISLYLHLSSAVKLK